MQPRIIELKEKKFAGKRIVMSFVSDKTYELWKSFMPLKKEIRNCIGDELYSIEVYPPFFFDKFNPYSEFDKWAALMVSDFNSIPEGIETIVSPEGLYAVFLYKGSSSEAHKVYQFIFNTWLPGSDYLIDERPHFAIMGEKYKNNDPDSEEEICIPVKKRS